MKLLFLAPEFFNAWGGVGIYSIELIKSLSKLNNLDIHVVTPDIKDKARKVQIKSIFNDSIKVHTISMANDTFIYNLKFQTGIFKEFHNLNKKYDFDIIHSANLVHMPDIFVKFQNINTPSVVTAHTTIKGQVDGFLQSSKNPFNMATSEKLSLLTYPGISFLEWYYLRSTQNIITVSKKFKKILKKEYNYKGKIATIYNSIDIKNFNFNALTEKECINKFPFLNDIKGPTVLYAGRLVAQKGIDVFLKSIKTLEKTGHHYNYIIAGKGNYKRLFQIINKLNLNSANINYIGHIDNLDLPYIYKMSDIFVLPSYYENLPISLLEAMSMKCCCIASNVGAIDEIIENKTNGILINPGDHQSLSNNIINLAENTNLMHKLSEKARKKVLKNFRSSIMAKKTYKVYKSITKNEAN